MVDAGDSKSPDSNIVRVQVSPRAPLNFTFRLSLEQAETPSAPRQRTLGVQVNTAKRTRLQDYVCSVEIGQQHPFQQQHIAAAKIDFDA